MGVGVYRALITCEVSSDRPEGANPPGKNSSKTETDRNACWGGRLIHDTDTRAIGDWTPDRVPKAGGLAEAEYG